MGIGWVIGIVLAIICIIACCRSFYGKARFYCNLWDVAGSAVLTIATIVAFIAAHNTSSAGTGGFHWLYVVLPVMVLYHGVIAFVSNASTADAFCIWIGRTTLTAVWVIFVILAASVGDTKQRDDERDGEYIMRSLSSKAASAAILWGIAWFAHKLVNEDKIERDDYIDVESRPVSRPYPESSEPIATPQVEYRNTDPSFTYRWRIQGQEFRGQKTCQSEFELRRHVEGLGGEMLEVINS